MESTLKKLGDRNFTLLSMGAKTTGSFIEGYQYVEEQLYTNEAEILWKFVNWIHEDLPNRAFGWGNYEKRFKEFLGHEKSNKAK